MLQICVARFILIGWTDLAISSVLVRALVGAYKLALWTPILGFLQVGLAISFLSLPHC